MIIGFVSPLIAEDENLLVSQNGAIIFVAKSFISTVFLQFLVSESLQGDSKTHCVNSFLSYKF